MKDKNNNLNQFIPTDFILVRFEILGDLYSMNDYFNKYLTIKGRGYEDKKDFNIWVEFIRRVYIQIRKSMASGDSYKAVVKIMDEVLIKDRQLIDAEAREITLKINDFLYEMGLTDITQEYKDLGAVFEKL